jgi:xylulokinase
MYLGIDVGTSAVKAVLIDADDRPVAQASAPLTIQRPHPGWSEQDPEQWWQGTLSAVAQLPAAARQAVRSIGLSGQMHGATLLGSDARVLRPAILWNDGRSERECRQLESAEPALRSIAGNAAMPGFTAPKLLWVRQHEPAVFAQIGCVLLPKDYVRLRLTGERGTDPSDASGTLWLDVAQRRWSDRLLAATGLDERAMPRVSEGPAVTGALTRNAAGELGLPVVPVVAGAGDNAASAVGLGVTRTGQAFLSLGTSGVLFVVTDRFRPNPARGAHAFCHCLPGLWHQMAVLLSAGGAVQWATQLAGFARFEEATAAAQRRGLVRSVPAFLPYLSGERTPHNDPHARGVFFGLSLDTEPADLVTAALVGVTLAFADGLDALREAGSQITELSLCGGGARVDWWASLLASALDLPLMRPSGSESGAAAGAARLARAALEPGGGFSKASAERVFEPDAQLRTELLGRRDLFRRLYSDLKDTFKEHPP